VACVPKGRSGSGLKASPLYFIHKDNQPHYKYTNKNNIAGLVLEEEAVSLLKALSSSDIVKTPEDYSS
jgi:hypothetical protein